MTESRATDRSYHSCLVFDRDEEHLRALADHIAAGLDSGERALCLIHDLDAARLADTLAERGVDVGRETADGALQIVRARTAYLRDGSFDPVRMIELIAIKLHQARMAGYAGLRAAGEMSWALADPPGSEKLVEYERLLNVTAFRSPLLRGLCTYDARRFGRDLLDPVRRAHPINVATIRSRHPGDRPDGPSQAPGSASG